MESSGLIDVVRDSKGKFAKGHENCGGHNGHYHDPDYVVKQREAKLGPKNSQWKGGRAEWLKRQRAWRHAIKVKVLARYSGNTLKCACCGENTLEFLSIHHINGSGTKHSKRIGKRGSGFYLWLIKHNYPPGYGVLCMNCNFAIGHFGKCPHKESRGVD